MEVAVVRPLFVGAVWPAIKDYVLAACEMTGGRRTPTRVLAEAMDGITILWVAYDDEQEVKAFATTRICQYDAVTLLCVEMAGGEDLDSWATPENFDVFIKFAQDNGCSGIEIHGRGNAWARKLKQQGWENFSNAVELRWD